MNIYSISRSDSTDIPTSIVSESRSRGFRTIKVVYKKKNDDADCFPLFVSKIDDFYNKIITKISGRDGFHSFWGTRKLLKQFQKVSPDIILLHYPHGYFLNIPMLFSYCSKRNIPIVFVANDCWAFTGRCTYFEFNGCYKWRNGCGSCPFPHEYPRQIFFDKTKKMWEQKKNLFVSKNVYFVSPSQWLLNYIHSSFLSDSQSFLIYNGTDLNGFQFSSLENVRREFSIPKNKKMILGFARPWSERKGLAYFNYLAKKLPNEDFCVVVVGVSEKEKTESNVIRISQFLTKHQLASLFSEASVFVNPTLDEVWGLVNIECLACGTPIVAFESGGVPEAIDQSCGRLVPAGNADALLDAVLHTDKTVFSSEACRKRSSLFSLDKMAKEYVDLLEKIVHYGEK